MSRLESMGLSLIKTKDRRGGGMARDFFSGGDIQFEFTDMREHELKQLLYYHRKFGFGSCSIEN
jgi:hypothetical protein